ncbi:hypothetical protein [Sinomonas mesophila]|uniref:hypothetical protein n=1 Tax=Sinomonas mesophila TaxID=1531955 RepID=UPI0011155A74|nr:hypothetical protein [Sinomonas mesophila]
MAAVLALYALACLLVLAVKDYTVLLLAAVAAGLLQAPLLSLTHDTAFQFVDDIPAALVLVGAVLTALGGRLRSGRRALLLLAALLGLVAFGVARSPDIGVGLAQARQVLLPLGLVFAGYVLRDRIRWRVLYGGVAVFAAAAVAWTLTEEAIQAPLIDPVWYYVEAVGGKPSSLREGLPPAYFADGVGGETVFRPGGPFMNPPVLGFFLGLGSLAARFAIHSMPLRWAFYGMTALALFFSYARAGILIFLVLTVVYMIWVKLGRFAGTATGAMLGLYLAATFIEQGNTASHSKGLGDGLMAGVTSPLGIGFGSTGYQAALEGAENAGVSESLLGLYFAWLGLPMIIAVVAYAWACWRRILAAPRKLTSTLWVSLAMALGAASSESASSMAATPVLWFVCGAVLVSAPQTRRAVSRRRSPSLRMLRSWDPGRVPL